VKEKERKIEGMRNVKLHRTREKAEQRRQRIKINLFFLNRRFSLHHFLSF